VIAHRGDSLHAPEQTLAAYAADLAVWPWSTTAAGDIERSHRMGVDGLMGDDVAAIVRELGTPSV
jgi:glycerophosphoryl diester phosphodiesterase